jgi:hypothetical protein
MIPLEIANFFTAMQAGRDAAARLEAAFAEDAVYVEPFSGQVRSHTGRAAILAAMARGWEQPLPAMSIRIDHAETRGAEVMVRWTCFSPALPGGQGSGLNRFILSGGRIARLETSFT